MKNICTGTELTIEKRHTDFGGMPILDEALKHGAFPNLNKLSYLNVEEKHLQTLFENSTQKAALENLHALRLAFHLTATSQGMQTFREAVQRRTLSELRSLDISGGGFGEPGMQSLIQTLNELSSLTTLNVHSTFIGERGNELFASYIQTSVLKDCVTLNLDSNMMFDTGLVHFANAFKLNMKNLKNLQNLSLVDNNISSVGLTYLAESCRNGALPKLKNLNLKRNLLDSLIGFIRECKQGALQQLQTLNLAHNELLETTELRSLENAKANGDALQNLETVAYHIPVTLKGIRVEEVQVHYIPRHRFNANPNF